MERDVKIHGVYKHFKGDYYLVEDVANHSETKEKYVVYRRLYGDNSLWIRPLDMFLSEVDHEKYPNVKQKYRFELQDIQSVANNFKGWNMIYLPRGATSALWIILAL